MKSTTKRSMTDRFVDGCYRWMPNSIVLVFLLTVLVAVLAVIFWRIAAGDIHRNENEFDRRLERRVWSLLSFAMQMSLVMLTGYILASAPVVKRGLTKLASIPNTTAGAMLLWRHCYLHRLVGTLGPRYDGLYRIGPSAGCAGQEKGV